MPDNHQRSVLSSSSSAIGKPVEARILSANFIFATLANFFNSLGSQMMNTTLPVYVLSIGGGNLQAGLVGGVLPITALFLRPLVGWVTDVWKRRSLATIGSSFYGLASVIYALSNSIGTLVLGRVIHGVGISGYTTAANAYIVDIAPKKRRAETLGLFAVTTSLGLIIGPTIGFYIVSHYDFQWLFNFATLLAVITCIVSLFAREKTRLPNSQRPTWSLRTGILAVDALPMAWIALCLGFAMGSVANFIAIFAKSRGIENPGFFFTVQAFALLISRTFSGRLADKYGRVAAIIPGIIVISIALATIPLAHELPHFMISAALFGLGFGAAQPATMALLADHVPSEQQGLGVSTYFIGFDGGVFLGSVAFGVASQNWGFGLTWFLAAVCTLLGLFGLLWARHTRISRSE